MEGEIIMKEVEFPGWEEFIREILSAEGLENTFDNFIKSHGYLKRGMIITEREAQEITKRILNLVTLFYLRYQSGKVDPYHYNRSFLSQKYVDKR